jgi:hypothetical protein
MPRLHNGPRRARRSSIARFGPVTGPAAGAAKRAAEIEAARSTSVETATLGASDLSATESAPVTETGTGTENLGPATEFGFER